MDPACGPHKLLALAQQLLEREGLTGLIEKATGGVGWRGKHQALQALLGDDRRVHWDVGDTDPDQQAVRNAGYLFAVPNFGYGHCPDADARIDIPLPLLGITT